ncbi:Uncharacterised protein [uncultured Clostridium sp.]|nr:Uncharacterised protein [uncultured Clostridium sp.]
MPARFFVEKRKDPDYIPNDPMEIEHVDKFLKLMAVLTGDNRYVGIVKLDGKEIVNMYAYWGIRQASGSNAAIVLMVAVMVMQYLSFRGHASAGDVIVDGILTWDGGIYLLIFAFFALIIVNLLLKAWVDKRGGSAE